MQAGEKNLDLSKIHDFVELKVKDKLQDNTARQ